VCLNCNCVFHCRQSLLSYHSRRLVAFSMLPHSTMSTHPSVCSLSIVIPWLPLYLKVSEWLLWTGKCYSRPTLRITVTTFTLLYNLLLSLELLSWLFYCWLLRLFYIYLNLNSPIIV
jgi:hypothetical protein